MAAKPIALVGGSQYLGTVCEKASALDLPVTAVSAGDPRALPDTLARGRFGGLLVLEKALIPAAAAAARELNLPSISPDVALRALDRQAFHDCLRAAGLPSPDCEPARTEADARKAMNRWGGPVLVRPRRAGTGCRGLMRIDHVADLSLGLAKAAKHDPTGEAVVERFETGDTVTVEGLIHKGRFIPAALVSGERSTPPFLHWMGIHTPALLSSASAAELPELAGRVCQALGASLGPASVTFVLGATGPAVVSAGFVPGDTALRGDLARRAYGIDYLAECLRVAAGAIPKESAKRHRAAALYWIPSRSGVITAVEGVKAAKEVAGVEEVAVAAHQGDRVGHIVDEATRDRIGYVVAVAENTPRAIAAAKAGRDAIRVLRRPTLADD